MTVGVDSASNVPVERPAGSHSLAAAAHCRRWTANAIEQWRGTHEVGDV
jgi:hypothetical protein